MNEQIEIERKQRVEDFFKSPNGTILCEKYHFNNSAIYAIKLPLGGEDRFSAVMTSELSKDQFNESGIFPGRDSKLVMDSYVDNRTGKRVICGGSSDFEMALGYKDGIKFFHARNEIQAAVKEKIATMSDEDLTKIALANGRDPEGAKILNDHDRETVEKDCREAFVFDTDPECCVSDIIPNLELTDDINRDKQARFAMSYLKDKDQFIQELADHYAPKYCITLLHARAIAREAERYMEDLREFPKPALVKEHDIRKAIEGKASIWATFGKGSETLHMSVPTAMFRSSNELNDYALTDKDRRRLAAFIKGSDSRYGCWSVYISDIVALDYKGKTLYQDNAFYDQHREQGENAPSFDSILQNAKDRAEAQLNSGGISQEPTR